MKEHMHNMDEKHSKSDNMILGIAAIMSILLIVVIATHEPRVQKSFGLNAVGMVTYAVADETHDGSKCRLSVGRTAATTYNSDNMAVDLEIGSSTNYAGNDIFVSDINSDGCVINVNGHEDYLVVGQIQKVGPVYITIKDIIQ